MCVNWAPFSLFKKGLDVVFFLLVWAVCGIPHIDSRRRRLLSPFFSKLNKLLNFLLLLTSSSSFALSPHQRHTRVWVKGGGCHDRPRRCYHCRLFSIAELCVSVCLWEHELNLKRLLTLREVSSLSRSFTSIIAILKVIHPPQQQRKIQRKLSQKHWQPFFFSFFFFTPPAAIS